VATYKSTGTAPPSDTPPRFYDVNRVDVTRHTTIFSTFVDFTPAELATEYGISAAAAQRLIDEAIASGDVVQTS
jgi:hypothetical protein